MIGAGNGASASRSLPRARAPTLTKLHLSLADGQFKKLSTLLERDDWATSPSFSTNSQRVANRTTLVPLIEDALSAHPTAHWLERFKGGGFPFAPVNDIKGTFEHPQTVAREMVREVEHPRAGKIKLVAPAVQYNGQRMEVRPLSSLSRSISRLPRADELAPLAVHAPAAGPQAALGRGPARARVLGRPYRRAAAEACHLDLQ